MAGRFLFRKLSSRMSRSTSLLGAYESACATAGEPVTRRAWEGSFRIHKHVPAAHHTSVASNNSMINGYAARYFRTLPCTRAASETCSPANGVPSAITLKKAFVNSVGVKQTFSSSPSTNNAISLKPKVSTSRTEWKAKYASDKPDMDPDLAAWIPKRDADLAAFGVYMYVFLGGWCLILWGLTPTTDPGSGSRCSTCCKCQSTYQKNPKTE